MDITYYECHDSGNLYAEVSGAGIFRLWANDRDGGGDWQFLEPGSDVWEYTSRKLYWRRDVVEINLEAIEPPPPPLPPVPEGPFPTWEERRGRGERYSVEAFPGVADVVARSSKGLTIFVVLSWDGYESAFGDGRVEDFNNAFYSLIEAQDFIRDTKGDPYTGYEITSFSLETDGASLFSDDFAPTASQHYTVEECLNALNEDQLPIG